MRKATRIITLIALLCIGLFIGYLWNDYTTNTDTTREVEEEVISDESIDEDINTGSAIESGATLEEDLEVEDEDVTSSSGLVVYEPLIVNDNETTFDISSYPEFDDKFAPALDNIAGTAPQIVRTNQTSETLTEWFKLTGKVSKDVERIDVIWDGDMTPFTLQKFSPGTTDFQYNMNPEYDNLKDGKNYYLIRAYAKDNLYQKVIEVEYQSAPRSDDLDDAFKS